MVPGVLVGMTIGRQRRLIVHSMSEWLPETCSGVSQELPSCLIKSTRCHRQMVILATSLTDESELVEICGSLRNFAT